MKHWKEAHHGGGGAVYGLGLIGALIYFLQHSHNLSEVLIGIIKAVLWPGFFVYRVFEFLKL